MKRWLRMFIISTLSLWIVNQWVPSGLVITGGFKALLQAGLGLMLANSLVKPLFSILMLPINLLTFGLFRWVTNVAMLWLVVRFVGGIGVQPFKFVGLNYAGLIIPEMSFNLWVAWIVISFLVSLVAGFIIWLVGK